MGTVMSAERCEDLIARQKAMVPGQQAYDSDRQRPKEELYGLTSQVRTSATRP
jgi:hypothetical protein